MKNTKKEDWKYGTINLLVLSGNEYDYQSMFDGVEVNGIKIVCEQCSIMDIKLSVYEPSKQTPFGLQVDIRKKNQRAKTFHPHFLFIRTLCRGMTGNAEKLDHRNILFGFMNSGIPSVNSLECIYNNLERAIVHGELRKIQRKLGHENFPLIEQYYHSGSRQLMFTPGFPTVCKISHVHAGFGKIVVNDQERLKDVSSVLALHKDYCTSEKFIDADYELRLQRIGDNSRIMKKKLVSGWKTNDFGTSFHDPNVKIEEKYLTWMNECSKLFGGMDIFALDVLHGKDGKYYILELNGCAIGLNNEYEKQDLIAMKELVLKRIEEKLFCKEASTTKMAEKKDVEIMNLKNELLLQKEIVNGLKKQIMNSSNSKKKNNEKKGLFSGLF